MSGCVSIWLQEIYDALLDVVGLKLEVVVDSLYHSLLHGQRGDSRVLRKAYTSGFHHQAWHAA